MISMLQFMTLYGGYYYECHCFYIFTIHFLFSFTQSHSLLFVLSIDPHCFSSVCLSVVVVGTFDFICGRYWCLCTRLESGSVSLSFRFVIAVGAFVLVCQCFCLVPSCSWYRVAVVWLLSLVCLPVCSCC